MFDILLSQLGIKPGELKEMANRFVRESAEANARMKRIELKLGITEPLVLEEPQNDG